MTGSLRSGTSADEVFGRLSALLHGAGSAKSRHTIALLDIDHLTEINRLHGRATGDLALQLTSAALALALRSGESGTRWSGDQYVVVLPFTGRAAGERRIRQILAGIRTHAGQIPGISAGVATYPGDGLTNRALVEAAAAALRQAKRDKREAINSRPPRA